jgi:hypothetical protein
MKASYRQILLRYFDALSTYVYELPACQLSIYFEGRMDGVLDI